MVKLDDNHWIEVLTSINNAIGPDKLLRLLAEEVLHDTRFGGEILTCLSIDRNEEIHYSSTGEETLKEKVVTAIVEHSVNPEKPVTKITLPDGNTIEIG